MKNRFSARIVAVLAVCFSAFYAHAEEHVVTIGTGSVNGVYYPAGGAICRLVNRSGAENGMHCYAESTGGSIANIRALKAGNLDFAIAQSDWQYKAYKGEGDFSDAEAVPNLRSVLSLHTEMLTIAAGKNSGIKHLADIRGKRINAGEASSGMREQLQILAGALGWGADYAKLLDLKPVDAVQALCDGKIDAIVVSIGHPNGLVQEATSRCGARLVSVEGKPVDDLLARTPYYARAIIPGGMYQNNPQPVSTFGVKATLLTSASEDEETVYQVTKAVFDNFDSFKTLHFVFATLDRQHSAKDGLVAPLHPGALRYFKEVGLIKE